MASKKSHAEVRRIYGRTEYCDTAQVSNVRQIQSLKTGFGPGIYLSGPASDYRRESLVVGQIGTYLNPIDTC